MMHLLSFMSGLADSVGSAVTLNSLYRIMHTASPPPMYRLINGLASFPICRHVGHCYLLALRWPKVDFLYLTNNENFLNHISVVIQ